MRVLPIGNSATPPNPLQTQRLCHPMYGCQATDSRLLVAAGQFAVGCSSKRYFAFQARAQWKLVTQNVPKHLHTPVPSITTCDPSNTVNGTQESSGSMRERRNNNADNKSARLKDSRPLGNWELIFLPCHNFSSRVFC